MLNTVIGGNLDKSTISNSSIINDKRETDEKVLSYGVCKHFLVFGKQFAEAITQSKNTQAST